MKPINRRDFFKATAGVGIVVPFVLRDDPRPSLNDLALSEGKRSETIDFGEGAKQVYVEPRVIDGDLLAGNRYILVTEWPATEEDMQADIYHRAVGGSDDIKNMWYLGSCYATKGKASGRIVTAQWESMIPVKSEFFVQPTIPRLKFTVFHLKVEIS